MNRCKKHQLEIVTSLELGNPKINVKTIWEIKYCPQCKKSYLFLNGELEDDGTISKQSNDS